MLAIILFFLGHWFLSLFFHSFFLHRFASHKMYTTSKGWERTFYFTTWLVQGSSFLVPRAYGVMHRMHHTYSDTEKDPHSPIYGFWHSSLLWMFRIRSDGVQFRYVVDLLRNKEIVWFSTHYTKIWLVSNLAFILISWDFFLYFSMMGAFATLVTYNLTNSLNHYSKLGYTNFATRDNSTNVPWLFPIVLGECWHNNHHARPGASHFGSSVSGNWWEFDPSGRFIQLFQD